MAKQINVNLNFDANTTQAQQALQQLNASLTKISNITPVSGTKLSKDLQIAKQSAIELQQHLINAFSVKTGNLDLGRLDASLKSAGQSLGGLSTNLLKAGSTGQEAFLNIQRSISNASVQINQANGLLTQFWTSLKNTARWQISSSILHGFIGSIQSAWGYAKDLDESLNNIRIVTGQNTEQMAKFAEQANKAAKALSTTTTQYTDAALIFYQQGLKGDDVTDRADITIKMANASAQSAEIVSDQLTAIWNNFYNGSDSLESYADKITALGAATASSSTEIATGLEKFASVAETVGLSYDYATAALATVTATTRQSADVVGTAFKTLFARLNDLKLGETLDDGTTLGQYTENLAKVGVNIKDASGSLKDMDVILEETAAKWQNLDRDQQVALAKGVAGIRQYNQFIALMDNWDFMEENLKTVEGSTGTLQNQADIYAESWAAAMDRVKASAEGIYRDLFPTEELTGLANGFADFLEGIDSVVQGLGGLKGILLLISSIVLTVFQNQIGSAIDNSISKISSFSAIGLRLKSAFTGTVEATRNISNTLTDVNAKGATGAEQSKIFKDNFEKSSSLATKMSNELGVAATNTTSLSSNFQNYSTNLLRVNNVQALIEQSSKYLTAEQREQLSLLQQQALEANEQLLVARDAYELEKQRSEVMLNSTGDDVSNLDRFRVNEADETKTNFDSSLFASNTNVSAVTEMNDEWMKITKSAGDAAIEVGRYKNHISLALGQSADLEKVNKSVNKTYSAMYTANKKIAAIMKDTTKTPKEQREAVQKVVKELKEENAEAAKIVSKYVKANKSTEEIASAMDTVTKKTRQYAAATGSSEKNLTNIESQANKVATAFEKQSQAAENFNNKVNQVSSVLSKGLSSAMSFGNTLVGVAKGASQVAMAINSISNAIDTIGDEDASFTSKLTSGAMAAVMGLTGLMTVLKGVKNVIDSVKTATDLKRAADLAALAVTDEEKKAELGNLLVQKLGVAEDEKEAAVEAIVNKAKGEGTKKTIKDTIANWANVASQAAKLWYVTLIIAAVAALIALIAFLITRESEEEKQLKKSLAAQKELNAALDEAKQRAEDLKSAFSDYDSIVETLEKCTKGTQEWNEALNNVNAEVLKLLKEYPELATMINTDEDSEDFGESAISYGDSGEMVVADWARQELTEKANNYVSVAQAASIQGNQQVREDKIALQSSEFQKALEKEANSTSQGTVQNDEKISTFIADNIANLSKMTSEEQKEFINDYMTNNNMLVNNDTANRWIEMLNELDDEFIDLAEALDENTLATKTENRAIAASALSDNEAIQSSELSTDIINASGGLYEDLTNEAMTELAGWGKDNINQASTEKDKDAQKVWEEYLEAAGIKADDAKLTGVTGNDDNRAFVYEDAEGNEKTVSLDAMKQTKAAYEAMGKLDSAAQELATQFEVLASSATLSDHALQNFLANQNFFQATGSEVGNMSETVSESGGAEEYLDKMIGDGDGDLTDKTAQKYGFEDAAQMIEVFEEQLEEVEKQWTKVEETIPAGLEGIKDISLESAQALAEDYKLLADGPGGQEAVDALTEKINLLKGSMTEDQIPEFMEQIGNVDWTKWNALDDVQAILDGMDISLELTGAEWETFAEKMRNAAGATPAEEFDKIKNNLSGLGSAINGINPGELIDKTQYESLIALNEDLADSFIQTADGFKYIGTEEINVDDLKLKDELDAMNKASSTFNKAKDAYENSSINKMANSAFDNTDYAAQAEKLESEIDDKYAQKEKELGKGAGGGWYGEDDKAKAEEYKEGLEEEVEAKRKQQEAADTKNQQLKDDLKTMAGEIQSDENLMEVAKAMGYNEEQIQSMVDNEEYEKLQTLAKNVDKYMQEGLAGKYDSTELQEKMAATATNVSELNQMMFDGLITDTEIYGKQLTALTMDAITNATTLEELNNAIAIGGDYSYDMVADALLRIGEQYDNCSQEMAEFENALLTGNEEVIQSAQESLEVAIMLGEAAEEYGVSAEEMEIQASQLAKEYGISEKAAAKLAIQNQRMNKGIASLAENWKDWKKELQKADKTTTDYAKAAAETTKAVADLVGASEDLELPPEFLESDENLELIGKAAEGDTQAIQELGMAVAKTQIDMMKLDADVTKTLQDGTTKSISMDQFNSAKEQVLKGIEELQQKVIDGSIAVGQEVSSMGSDWVNSLNEMAMATNISVEDMNALLSELGVQTEVKVEEVKTTRNVPVYRTEMTNVKYDDYDNIIGYDMTTTSQGTTPMEEIIEVAQIGAEGEVDPPKVTFSGRGSASQSAVESGSSGSTSKAKDSHKKKSDAVDRYKEVNDNLEKTSRLMEKNSTLADGLWGKNRINMLKENVKQMKKENDLLKEKIKLANDYLTEDRTDLEATGAGFKFDGDGYITNYTEVMEGLFAEYNTKWNSFSGGNEEAELSEEQQEVLDKMWEHIETVKAAYEKYEGTLDEVQDLQQEQIEKDLAIQQENYNILNEELEIKLSINEDDLSVIEYYLNKMSDDFYSMAEAAALMVGDTSKKLGEGGRQLGNYLSNLALQEDQYYTLRENFETKDPETGKTYINQQQYIEGLRSSRDALIDNLNSLNELDKTMLNYYSDTLAAASEELSKYTTRMEHQTSVLEHYSSVMEIMGKQQDYESMGVILEAQAQTIEDQMEVAKANYEMLVEQEKLRREAYDEAIARGASEKELEIYKNNWEAAADAANEAQEEMLSKTEAWAEAMKAVVENKLSGLAQSLENALTGEFGSFDALSTQMEHAVNLQEEYLTTTNKIYETNKMMRTAQQEIDKSTNSVAKKKLKNFINETEQLQNQTKLSQYELEIQQAKYDLLLAEIALEEAQGAKSTVRLQRDSEGNFGYVYTADQNAIAEAEQKFADAQNSLYNIGLEGANNYTEKYQQTLSEFYNTMTEFQTQYLNGEFENEQEYQDKMAEAKDFYYKKLQEYSELYTIAIGTDARVIQDAWSTEFQTMVNGTEEWKTAVDGYVDEVNLAFEGWEKVVDRLAEQTVGKNLTTLKTKTSDITNASKSLKTELIGADGKSGLVKGFGDVANAVANTTGQYAAMREEINRLITEYEKLLGTINKDIQNENNGQSIGGTKTGDSTTSTDTSDNTSNSADSTPKTITKGANVKASSSAQIYDYVGDTSGEYQYYANDPNYVVMSQDGEWVLVRHHTQSAAAGWFKKSDLTAFDTGGYTGDWGGSYGKLAMLHQKELILKEGDTENFLASMELLDNIVKTIDLYSANAQWGGILSSPTFGNYNGQEPIEQNVYIEANFPEATDRNEIIEAINTLSNQASQLVNRK